MYPPDMIARFWGKVQKCPHGESCKECCWPWQGHKTKGYGTFFVPKKYRVGKNKEARAGRICLEIITGKRLPPELHACHNCPGGDNTACINPAHLWAGTIDDNQKDSMRKGRRPTGDNHGLRKHPEAVHRGEDNHLALLTTEDVLSIREYGRLGHTQQHIAEIFGTSRANISCILRRKSWKHLPDER